MTVSKAGRDEHQGIVRSRSVVDAEQNVNYT